MSKDKLTFEQFKEAMKDSKYNSDSKCICCGSNNAFWEGGDARYYCSVCEEHAGLESAYKAYLKCTIWL